MLQKHIPVPFEVLNLLPLVIVIDSSGIIVWAPPKNNIVPSLSIDKNILDFVPNLILEKLLTKAAWNYAAFNGMSYLIHNYPLDNKQGAILYFEFVETTSLNMLLENSYEGFILIDKRGIIRAVNETLANYMKLPKEKLIGQHFDKFKIDRELHRILETQKPDLLTVFVTWGKNGLASRHPVYSEGKFVGVYGRYFSIDGRDLKENTFGEGYANLLEDLPVSTLAQAMAELNNYKHEFYEKNTTRYGVDKIIGNSPEIKQLKKKAVKVGSSPSTILLTGESGTGKDLFAKAVHFHSNRSNYPFVKVNCAAIPENLLESELFGYVDGAFTGARKGGKMGKFELANKGIIFLDEIGDMPLSMQSKLLRVLQENEIERLGAEKETSIDVRVISATNQDLPSMILEGTFRADLYYRLCVINFHIPPLRERKEDLPELINYFINTLNEKLHINIKGVSPQAMDKLINYNWPGNIRELVNVLEAAMNFCRNDFLESIDLPHFFHTDYLGEALEEDLQATMDQVKKSEVIAALNKSEGKRKIAASILGVSKSTLYRLMRKYDLVDFES